MFIIKWLDTKNHIYYRYYNSLIGARINEYPYLGRYFIGYINNFGHEIIDINYLYDNKIYSYEDYINGSYKENKKILGIFKKK